MTPPARIAAAIGILDRILAGDGVERALGDWARGSRFAGSKDRAAVRDLVFDALRRRRSYGALGGAETGRGLMIGALRAAGTPPETMFTGEGYAPTPLGPDETAPGTPTRAEALDCPDWLLPHLEESLGSDFESVMLALRARAPVFLRVNLAKTDVAGAISVLAEEGVTAVPVALAETALEVTEGARKIAGSEAFVEGLVELQDAASQAVVAALPLDPGDRVLDYCAGGGGKTLAMAGRVAAAYFAHDAAPARMRDLAPRAARAGVSVKTLLTEEVPSAAPFDLILADVPCSGSGSWRRDPQGKWQLTPERLDELCHVQRSILDEISGWVRPGGTLAYVTCSMLRRENEAQVEGFLARHPDWACSEVRRISPLEGGDGFFLAVFRHCVH